MITRRKRWMALTGAVPVLVAIVLVWAVSVGAQADALRSPDGKYEAVPVGSGKDRHYQVQDMETKRVVFTTSAQYPTPNDVKAGMFSPDAKEFAAAYHYGHEGSYTWIGVWSLANGQRVRTERKQGWTRDLASVFKK